MHRGAVTFEPFFDPEIYPDLELIKIDNNVTNYCHCKKCRNVICFFAIPVYVNSSGKVQELVVIYSL